MSDKPNKLKLWKEHPTWESAERSWDEGALSAKELSPIKELKQMPNMVGITEETGKWLKWKSLKWMVAKDENWKILKSFLKHPFKYGWAWLKSVVKGKSYKRDGDFFLYGIDSIKKFRQELRDKESLFILGFSYCHKPFECPSGRFTDSCIHDPENLVCRQCFIGKAVNALPEHNSFPLFIPTIHYIGGKIFDIIHQHPGKRVLFLITACELTLEMFGDWGNMVGIKGVGVRLDGRICNTMKAFELSEQGIKPGLTVVLDKSQKEILEFIRCRSSTPS